MSKPAETSPAAGITSALQDTIMKSVDSAIETATADTVTPPAPPAPPVVEKTFKDCEGCPEMKRLDGGVFTMGSPASESGHRAWEGPQREVKIPPFAVSTHEVTFAEWDACVAAGGCMNYTPADKGWGRGARPAIMVSWNDAQTYVKWLSGKTGKTYRLPTEAEWEYAARGGTTTAYWWGAKYESGRVTGGKTAEVGSHDANGFGLFDVTGNAAEWVEDCYVNSFKAAPVDGSAVKQNGCQRVVRGGGWKAGGADLRIANRSRLSATTRDTAIGFRVVVTG
jgi:formylglycine-generating enzyme required for sulfatase activity